MKNFFYLLLLLALPQVILAQSAEIGCGFAPDAATIQWMNSHHQAIERFHNNPDARHQLRAMKRVPLKFVAFSSGKTASLSQAEVNLAVANLNKAFQPMGIEFFSCHPPLNVLSSPYGSYLISEEKALWQEFKTAKVINVFCVESIEYGSVAGYTYLPNRGAPEALFMLKSHLSQSTFAHEMGHYYGLYHTHGKSNCDVPTDELVNDPNCARTGDDVCDTPADPNLQGLGCIASLVNSSTCAYTGTAKDKNGELYQPNPRNIMSYAWPKCKDYFSPGQYERMQYFSQFRIYPEECPAEVCTIPSITQIDSTYNSLQVQWTAFAQDSLYQVRYRTLGDTSWKTLNLTSNLWSLKNLKPCTKLEVQVRRACGREFSAWSNVLNLKTQGCGGVYCASFGGSTTAWLNRISIDTWAYTSGDDDGYLFIQNSVISLNAGAQYNVQLDPGGTLRIRDTLYWQIWVDKNRDRDFEDAGERVFGGKSPHRSSHKGVFTLPTDLSAGSSRLRVILSLNTWASSPCDTAARVIETEDYTITLRVPQICNKPAASNILLKKVTTNAVTIKTQGLDALRYQWELRQLSNNQLTYLSPELSVDSLYFLGLVENTRYQARLRTLCKNGIYSTWSDTLSFRTLAIPCPAPDSSTLVVKQIASTSAQLTCGTQAGAINYQFYYRAKGTDAWTSSPLLRVTTYTIIGLKAGTTYEYRARVYCSVNLSTVSAYSKTVQFTTLMPCLSPDSSDLKVSQLGHQSAVLQCASLSGAVFYEFSYRVRTSASWSTLPRVNVPTVTLQGLKPNTSYEFRVRVYCTSSFSEVSGYSKTSSFQTGFEPCNILPGELTVSKITPFGATINYSNKSFFRIEWRYRTKGDSIWKPAIFATSAQFTLNSTTPGSSYEVQVRKICVGGINWTDWSESVSFKALSCFIPDSVRVVPVIINAKRVRIFAENTSYGWYVRDFNWRYRQLGEQLWDSITITGENIITLDNLTPGATYEVEVDLICTEGGSNKNTYTKVFSMPEECFVLKKEEIKIRKVTNISARIEVQLPFLTGFNVRYRHIDSSNYIIQPNQVWNGIELNKLKPGSTYEIGIQIDCGRDADWSEPLYFTTPNCQLPYAGEISLLNVATDSVQASLEFFEYESPLDKLRFTWRYRVKGASTWTSAKEQNQMQVGLGNLTLNQDYEVQVSVNCSNESRDSFALTKTFRSVADICGQKPQRSWLRVKQDSAYYSATLSCNLNLGYNLEIRHRPKPASPKSWNDLKPTKIICGNSSLVFFFHYGPLYEVQFRVICPSGNVSAWSDVIQLENKLPGDCVTPTKQNIQIRNIQTKRATVVAQNLSRKRYSWYLFSPDDLSAQNFSTIDQDSLVLGDLKAGQTYQLRLGLVCTPYEVRWSEFVTFNTLSDTAANPCKPISPNDLTFTQLGTQEVELSLKNIQPQESIQWRYRKIGANDFWRTLSTQGLAKQVVYQLELGVTYEFQVRKLCKDLNTWSNWSESKTFATQSCALPIPERVFIQLEFYQFPELRVAFHANTGNYKYTYHFYRRLKGSTIWLDSIKTEQNSINFPNLIPDSTYEIQIKVFCGEFFATYTRYITVPSACFKIEAKSIVFENPTHQSINVYVQTVNTRLCQYRYRVKGTEVYSYHEQLGFNGYQVLENLTPGKTYELNARIKCADSTLQTDWSETVEFKTKSCLIPLNGDLAVLKYHGLDSVLLQADFGDIQYEPNLDYFWEYKLAQEQTWSKVYFRGTNLFMLKSPLKGATYAVRVKVKCPDEQRDSLFLETKLTIDPSQCSLPPDLSLVNIKLDQYSSWVLGVKLPSIYQFQVQYKNRQGTPWRISQVIPSNYVVSFGSGGTPQVIWFRIICPNGNVSPWSDSILTKPTQPLVEDGAAELVLQPISKAGVNPTLRISPNPSAGQFKVSLSQVEAASSGGLIEVFNLAGQKVYSQKLEGEEAALDLSNQASGLYFVRVLAGNQSFTERILLQKP